MFLAPSILAADFAHLEDEARDALNAGADWLHIDVMDGHFVPNITIGPLVVRALRPLADEMDAVLDVHLMIEQPEKYLEPFADAGADVLTIHAEADPHVHRTIQQVHDLGIKAGLSLNPGTPIYVIEEVLSMLDLVLVMSVNPGFGGQSFIPSSIDKIRRIRRRLNAIRSQAYLQVDGGVTPENAYELKHAGADVLVAGSAIFGGAGDTADNVQSFRRALLESA